MRGARVVAAVVALALVYPLATLARGAPDFPSRDDCVRPADGDGIVDAVFGHYDSETEARAVMERALAVGFPGVELTWNACGRVRVFLGGIPSPEVGRDFAEQARSVGFDVTLEEPVEP
jgi:hypothetical protein